MDSPRRKLPPVHFDNTVPGVIPHNLLVLIEHSDGRTHGKDTAEYPGFRPFVCFFIPGCGSTSKVAQDAKEVESFEAAKDAYVYAYPLMTMEMTRRVSTNFAKPEGTFAPMGQLAKLREYPNASFNAVTAPNADTL